MSDEPGPSSSISHGPNSSLSSTSSRHRWSQRRVKLTTNVRADTNRDAFDDIRRLLELFYEFAIPGPLLVRTSTEFSLRVGSGGQGQVRAASLEYASALRRLNRIDPPDDSIWLSDAAQQQCVSFWQNCVVKKLRSERGTLEIETQSAVREVYALCQASKSLHARQYVVRLLGWGLCLDALESGDLTRSSLPFLVLERAMCDMEEFVVQGRHQAQDQSSQMRMALDIGMGLQAIHAANMAHGDLKPSNVLIFPSDEHSWLVKICDFGSSSDGVRHKLRGHYTGTDTWRPPETFSTSEPVDLQACDIFAYGLVVWAWLTGRCASPIENVDGSQILVDLGQQQIYRRALFDVVERFGKPSDRAWLENESIFCPQVEAASDGWTRDFESPTINRVLNVLSVALDELPSRRKRQPWDFLKPTVPAKMPQPPQLIPRYRPKNKSADGIDTATHNTADSLHLLSRNFVSVSIKSGLEIVFIWGVFQLEHLVFALAGGESPNTFQRFHSVFSAVLGRDTNSIDLIRHVHHEECPHLTWRDIMSLKQLIKQSSYERFTRTSVVTTILAFWKHSNLPDSDHWSDDAIYALSRIRSRMVDDICWHKLFALDTDLRNTIDQVLVHVGQSSCKMALAWAMRNTSVCDIPAETHELYFEFLDDTRLSDEDMTFRMHFLLEKGFFLGQAMGTANSKQTVFGRYLLTLRDPKYAIQICQHFRRIASSDGVAESTRFYYTGTVDLPGSHEAGSHPTTCLHDAVRALNSFVTEFLLKTYFNVHATDEDDKTANSILDDPQALAESQRLHIMEYRQRRSEIMLMFSKLTPFKLHTSDLPLGWKLWPAGTSQAFVETSTDIEIGPEGSDANTSSYPYPVTFQKPSTGLYQANAIALVERQISDSEREPYLFNPRRFLRMQGQIDTGQDPARTPHFDESWYQAEALARHEFSDGILSGDAHNFQQVWSNVLRALRDRVRRVLPLLSGWGHVKSFPKFLLSGDLVIALMTPLGLVARYCGWRAEVQLLLSTFALMGVYARLWHTLDAMNVSSSFEFARPWLRTGDASLDQAYTCGTALLDSLMALLFAFRAHPWDATNFIIGSILFHNLLVLSLATIAAGRFSFRFEHSVPAGRPLRNFIAFPVFVAGLTNFLNATGVQNPQVERERVSLVVARAAAIVALLLAVSFHTYRRPEHLGPFFSDDKTPIIDPVTQVGRRTFGQTPDSTCRTAASMATILILGVCIGDTVVHAVVRLHHHGLSPSPSPFPSSWLERCATTFLVPLVSKSLVSIKIVALGRADQIPSVIMRTVGLSLDHGLVVLPALVVASWVVGRAEDHALAVHHLIFLFLQWLLLILTVYQGAYDWHWFRAVPLIGLYLLFVLFALVVPDL